MCSDVIPQGYFQYCPQHFTSRQAHQGNICLPDMHHDVAVWTREGIPCQKLKIQRHNGTTIEKYDTT